MIQKILEQCQKGFHGVGFNEAVLMLYNSVATVEVSPISPSTRPPRPTYVPMFRFRKH
jgi:hypothetical protein